MEGLSQQSVLAAVKLATGRQMYMSHAYGSLTYIYLFPVYVRVWRTSLDPPLLQIGIYYYF